MTIWNQDFPWHSLINTGIKFGNWTGIIIIIPHQKKKIVGENDLGSVRLSVGPRFVRADEYLQHQWIFVYHTLHMHLIQSSYESCEVSSGSNSKWPTYRHFCLLKLTKYLKMLSVWMNISNTNEYLFPIIYTCIYYNPPMNPYNLQQSFYPVGDTIELAIHLLLMYFFFIFVLIYHFFF